MGAYTIIFFVTNSISTIVTQELKRVNPLFSFLMWIMVGLLFFSNNFTYALQCYVSIFVVIFKIIILIHVTLNLLLILFKFPCILTCEVSIVATIKDIAKEAGVSQGTVSNVLNSKGNVSSQKIHLVQAAAKRLGYTMNQRAQVLRRGSSNTLAMVAPDLYNRQYVDFYTSFKKFSQEQGYQVNVYLTGDSTQSERQIAQQIRSNTTTGAAVFTSFTNGETIYQDIGLDKVMYVERRPGFPCATIEFDMEKIGQDFARIALKNKYQSIAILTENPAFSSQKLFLNAFQKALSNTSITVSIHHTDEIRCPNDAFQVLSVLPAPEAVFVTNYAFACTLHNVNKNFCPRKGIKIYALSPLFTMPGGELEKYELNYRLMGKTAAQSLIDGLRQKDIPLKSSMLAADGFRHWKPRGEKSQGTLTVVTLDSPSARILKHVSQLYTKVTGVEINVAIYSYDGLNEMLSNIEHSNSFDVIRIDSRRLSWYAEKTLTPLHEIDSTIDEVFDTFLPGLSKDYSHFDGTLYALPSTPSSQLLFYRKDLFENTAWRRQYAEEYQQELTPPTTFEEYNRIARFFTRKLNPTSPVPYGTTLTLGNSNVAGREYLTRYFSHSSQLYDKQQILLTSPQGVQSMEELMAAKECIAPIPSASWQSASREFSRGNAAMTVMFSNFASSTVDTNSQVLDKVGYTLVPGGNPMTGGSAIGVCRYSQHKEEALRFIRWLCTEEVATAMALMGTTSPCLKTYENYEVMDLYPWMVMAKDSFSLSHTSYVAKEDNLPFDEPKFLGILGMAVQTAYNEIMPVKEALQFAQSTFEKKFHP